jgi:5-hydroxyisourate hydrolase-like protein (transthyretin family)
MSQYALKFSRRLRHIMELQVGDPAPGLQVETSKRQSAQAECLRPYKPRPYRRRPAFQ